MTAVLRMTLILALVAPAATGLSLQPAQAKRIERACNNSNRSAANPPLCKCIQRVADQVLTRSDQRLAARFFKDPQKAQDVRQSDRTSHEEFWLRYKTFGTTAKDICG